MYRDEFLQQKLEARKEAHAFRQLRLPDGKTDFCSNDYLGIARQGRIALDPEGLSYGSTGSRLLAGNYRLIEEAEKEIARFHDAAAALIFNSGYDANLGLLSAVPQKGDTILYDALSHASIRDGIRLSFANSFSFAHNDLGDLRKKIAHARGTIFIVTESVFSMDGDACPLEELVRIANEYGAQLILDEAHATGVVGLQGAGMVQQLGLQQQVFARVHTFGKACGVHGAAILGSAALRDYLVNFARSFIFSTSLPEHSVAAIQHAYRLFPGMHAERRQLQELIGYFQSAELPFEKLHSATPIQGVIIPGNESVRAVAAQLQQQGLDVRPILYPTVPKGRERLRIVLHAFNTLQETEKLVLALRACHTG